VLIKGKKNREVTFICDLKSDARDVYLVGDFNQWRISETSRMRRAQDDTFRFRLTLSPGDHRYKYVVDGRWLADPVADRCEDDGFGAVNSVVHVAPPPESIFGNTEPTVGL